MHQLRTHYEAPPRPAKTFDYEAHKDGAIKHLEHQIRQPNNHFGRAQHFGGVASYINYLKEAGYGDAHAIMGELKEAMDYCVHYLNTGHEIHKFFACEELVHAKCMAEEIKCPVEKERATYFLECVVEYLNWICAEKGYSAMPPAPINPNPVNGIVSL